MVLPMVAARASAMGGTHDFTKVVLNGAFWYGSGIFLLGRPGSTKGLDNLNTLPRGGFPPDPPVPAAELQLLLGR